MEQQKRVVREIPATFQQMRRAAVEPLYDSREPTAAYARVSTDSEEQEDSFERQVDHYTKFIASQPNWKYVGIYADEGITGTRADIRPEFNRMIEDCRRGKIKRIICKSISRFARNTVDSLNYIRELKEIGVGVYFETHNINTLEPGGEILITILSALAEQESRNISKNVRWAYEKKFQNGEVVFNYQQFLGYTKNEDDEYVIVPEEAEIVRRIYREYLVGKTASQIAKEFTTEGIMTPSTKPKVLKGKSHRKTPIGEKPPRWYAKTILNILTNEKYTGNAIVGKTWKPDVLSKKRQINEGQQYKGYVENSHPAIIDMTTFELVQAEMGRRNQLRSDTPSNQGRYSSKYPLSKKLICGECGMPFRRHAHVSKGETIRTWVCVKHKKEGNEACTMRYVREDAVEAAFLAALGELVGDVDRVKSILKANIAESLDDTTAQKMQRVMIEIDEAQSEMLKLNREYRSEKITDVEYDEKGRVVAERIQNLNKEREELQAKTDNLRLANRRIEEIREALDNIRILDAFDGELFTQIVESVTVYEDELKFNFKIGITKSIALTRRHKREAA